MIGSNLMLAVPFSDHILTLRNNVGLDWVVEEHGCQL